MEQTNADKIKLDAEISKILADLDLRYWYIPIGDIKQYETNQD